MIFLLAGKPSGRTTLTVIDRILHTRLPKTHIPKESGGIDPGLQVASFPRAVA
jgi:hypothetical protein